MPRTSTLGRFRRSGPGVLQVRLKRAAVLVRLRTRPTLTTAQGRLRTVWSTRPVVVPLKSVSLRRRHSDASASQVSVSIRRRMRTKRLLMPSMPSTPDIRSAPAPGLGVSRAFWKEAPSWRSNRARLVGRRAAIRVSATDVQGLSVGSSVFGASDLPHARRGADADALTCRSQQPPSRIRPARTADAAPSDWPRPVFRWRRIWLLHRPRHFHLLVDVGRQLGLR